MGLGNCEADDTTNKLQGRAKTDMSFISLQSTFGGDESVTNPIESEKKKTQPKKTGMKKTHK